MLEQCFTAGSFVDFTFQQNRPSETSGDFQSNNVARTTGLSLPSGGIVNFTWLDFIPGRITETPLTQDVLTGPMSGCWLTLYRRAGQRYVGHVGTDSNSPLATTNAKTKWNAFALKSYGGVMGGF